MPQPAHLVTSEEFETLLGHDHRYELVAGRVVPRMSPVGFPHGHVVMTVGLLLAGHVKARRLGAVIAEVGFTLARNPDTVRGPDLAFIQQGRIPARIPKGFWHGAPDLAVEVLSPDDRPSEIATKVEEYLAGGTRVVLVLDPDESSATVYRRSLPPITLRGDDVIDFDDVVPGFRCTVREVFD